jgi:hypothetical protein
MSCLALHPALAETRLVKLQCGIAWLLREPSGVAEAAAAIPEAAAAAEQLVAAAQHLLQQM